MYSVQSDNKHAILNNLAYKLTNTISRKKEIKRTKIIAVEKNGNQKGILEHLNTEE